VVVSMALIAVLRAEGCPRGGATIV